MFDGKTFYFYHARCFKALGHPWLYTMGGLKTGAAIFSNIYVDSAAQYFTKQQLYAAVFIHLYAQLCFSGVSFVLVKCNILYSV